MTPSQAHPGQPQTNTPVLALSGIHKSFPGVKALSNVSLRLFPGEVHTLMGQNGAGKSTLIKVLTGLYTPDAGHMMLDGQAISPHSTEDAQHLGISTVYQEVNLCPNLSVAENIFIGRYPRHSAGLLGKFGPIAWARMQAQARRLLADMDIHIDVKAPLSSYSLSIQQMVAIARALNISAKVLILDEPTSSLDEAAVQLLFRVLRQLRGQGMAILFVTHFLEQTYAISDRITVMRNGETEGEYPCAELNRLALVNKMVGAPDHVTTGRAATATAAETTASPLAITPPHHAGRPQAAPFLQAQGLGRAAALQGIDLSIRRGEVLGLCGLLGSGRTETARLLFGADVADSGSIAVKGTVQSFKSPRDAIAAGIGFCSEDRKHEGAVLALSVRENIILALQARSGMARALPMQRQRALAEDFVQRLGIKTPDIDTPIGLLSGGNQQKALLARWLATDPQLLILDEPTRGIDVRAKEEIMDYVTALSHTSEGQGMAILFISSELPEVLHCSDRLMVLRDRKAGGEFGRGELDERRLLEVIAGASA
ncbi:sugar ABC transporter ATP-binding protein [Roseateles koreensis]|uniref:Sugar ABC transporter ATP-binding protein n=1 Tax=Roseateles koreensis TaxID=2987526 RepID=A0ABT5KVN1_9BURK|nr:sugar ABC transporter ATP-binding protein [Roseateles koreensis]MDC8786485.1 sugar ABC transporter ATP-binding protein [Roseateles koreensis]